MKNFLLILIMMMLVSCSSAEKGIAAIDRPDYTPFEVSDKETTINGKYVECTMRDQEGVRSFHIGNGKIYRIFSSWGRAEAGETNYAYRRSVDLINEDKDWLEFGSSNREYAKYCGAPLIGLEETIFKIRRFDGWISESTFEASDRTYGSNRDGFMTVKKIGDDGECKLFKQKTDYGACTFVDVDPNVDKFLEPYRPKGL